MARWFSGLHLLEDFLGGLNFPANLPPFVGDFVSPNLHWSTRHLLVPVRPCRDWLLWKTPEEIKCESNSNLDDFRVVRTKYPGTSHGSVQNGSWLETKRIFQDPSFHRTMIMGGSVIICLGIQKYHFVHQFSDQNGMFSHAKLRRRYFWWRNFNSLAVLNVDTTYQVLPIVSIYIHIHIFVLTQYMYIYIMYYINLYHPFSSSPVFFSPKRCPSKFLSGWIPSFHSECGAPSER